MALLESDNEARELNRTHISLDRTNEQLSRQEFVEFGVKGNASLNYQKNGKGSLATDGVTTLIITISH